MIGMDKKELLTVYHYVAEITRGDPREDGATLIERHGYDTLVGAKRFINITLSSGYYGSVYAKDGEAVYELNKL